MRGMWLYMLAALACVRSGDVGDPSTPTFEGGTAADTGATPTTDVSPCYGGEVDRMQVVGLVSVHGDEPAEGQLGTGFGHIGSRFRRVLSIDDFGMEVVDPLEGIDDCAVILNEFLEQWSAETLDGGPVHYDLGGHQATRELVNVPPYPWLEYPDVSFQDDLRIGLPDAHGMTFSVRSEGADVPAFDLEDVVTFPEPLELTGVEQSAMVTVDELELRWTPGPPGAPPLEVYVIAQVPISAGQPTLVARCTVADDGSWTVPAMDMWQWIDYDEWPRGLLIHVYRVDRCMVEVEPAAFVEVSAILQVNLGLFVDEE